MELTIPSMSCAHCVQVISQTVKAVDPQAVVDIDLAAQRARIKSQHDREAILLALTNAGYAPAP